MAQPITPPPMMTMSVVGCMGVGSSHCSWSIISLPYMLISNQAHSPGGRSKRYTCFSELLNTLEKGSSFHPARPIKKARASPAVLLRATDDEKVVLRAPQYKGTSSQERCWHRRSLSMFYAGIDWADQKHDGLALDEAGQKLGSIRVAHTPEGLDKLDAWLSSMLGGQDKEQMACIIETTHGLLISFLLERGWPVYPVNPRTVDRKRSASGSKTDAIDAYLLAKTGRADFADLRRLTPDSEKIAELKELTRDQDTLIRTQTRLVNQLTACLKAYYPVALELFSKLQQKSTLLFLQAYPTFETARAASLKELQQQLKQTRHPHPADAAASIVELLHQPQLQADVVLTRTKSRLMLALVTQLLPLMEQLGDYDKEISTLLLTHEDPPIFKRLAPARP